MRSSLGGALRWGAFWLVGRKEWSSELGRLLSHLLGYLYGFLVERLGDLGRLLLHLLGDLRELLGLTMRVVVVIRHSISLSSCGFR